MTNNSPIFPIHQPHHFNDYGFDPDQIPYFQVLEEARNHKRKTSSFKSTIDNLHFKLQKPFTKDDNSKKIKKTRKRWWKKALHFFKRKCTPHVYAGAGARALSAPVYWAEGRSGSSALYHRTATNGPSSRPLAGTITTTRKGDVNIPYVSLNELNMDQTHKISASPMPIYLVT